MDRMLGVTLPTPLPGLRFFPQEVSPGPVEVLLHAFSCVDEPHHPQADLVLSIGSLGETEEAAASTGCIEDLTIEDFSDTDTDDAPPLSARVAPNNSLSMPRQGGAAVHSFPDMALLRETIARSAPLPVHPVQPSEMQHHEEDPPAAKRRRMSTPGVEAHDGRVFAIPVLLPSASADQGMGALSSGPGSGTDPQASLSDSDEEMDGSFAALRSVCLKEPVSVSDGGSGQPQTCSGHVNTSIDYEGLEEFLKEMDAQEASERAAAEAAEMAAAEAATAAAGEAQKAASVAVKVSSSNVGEMHAMLRYMTDDASRHVPDPAVPVEAAAVTADIDQISLQCVVQGSRILSLLEGQIADRVARMSDAQRKAWKVDRSTSRLIDDRLVGPLEDGRGILKMWGYLPDQTSTLCPAEFKTGERMTPEYPPGVNKASEFIQVPTPSGSVSPINMFMFRPPPSDMKAFYDARRKAFAALVMGAHLPEEEVPSVDSQKLALSVLTDVKHLSQVDAPGGLYLPLLSIAFYALDTDRDVFVVAESYNMKSRNAKVTLSSNPFDEDTDLPALAQKAGRELWARSKNVVSQTMAFFTMVLGSPITRIPSDGLMFGIGLTVCSAHGVSGTPLAVSFPALPTHTTKGDKYYVGGVPTPMIKSFYKRQLVHAQIDGVPFLMRAQSYLKDFQALNPLHDSTGPGGNRGERLSDFNRYITSEWNGSTDIFIFNVAAVAKDLADINFRFQGHCDLTGSDAWVSRLELAVVVPTEWGRPAHGPSVCPTRESSGSGGGGAGGDGSGPFCPPPLASLGRDPRSQQGYTDAHVCTVIQASVLHALQLCRASYSAVPQLPLTLLRRLVWDSLVYLVMHALAMAYTAGRTGKLADVKAIFPLIAEVLNALGTFTSSRYGSFTPSVTKHAIKGGRPGFLLSPEHAGVINRILTTLTPQHTRPFLSMVIPLIQHDNPYVYWSEDNVWCTAKGAVHPADEAKAVDLSTSPHYDREAISFCVYVDHVDGSRCGEVFRSVEAFHEHMIDYPLHEVDIPPNALPRVARVYRGGELKTSSCDSPLFRSLFEERLNRLNPEQARFVNIALAGKHCMCLGKAGTGKSFTMRMALDSLTLQHGPKAVVPVAMTNALASAMGGVTFHSLIGVFNIDRPVMAGDRGVTIGEMVDKVRGNNEKRELIEGMRVLVLDEVGLIPGFAMRLLEWLFWAITGRHLVETVQIVVCGDFTQLSPVITTENRVELSGNGTRFFEWSGFQRFFKMSEIVVLTSPMRSQCPDLKRLVDALYNRDDSKARVTLKEVYEEIQTAEVGRGEGWPGNRTGPPGPLDGVTIVGSNKTRNALIHIWMGECLKLGHRVWQEPDVVRGDEVPFRDWPLRLVVGCRVRALATIRAPTGKPHGFIKIPSGCHGVVVSIPDGTPTGGLVVRFDKHGCLVDAPVVQAVFPADREDPTSKPKRGIPLGFDSVMTAALAQGTEYDRVKVVVLDGYGAGTVYMMCSRARSAKGLHLCITTPASFRHAGLEYEANDDLIPGRKNDPNRHTRVEPLQPFKRPTRSHPALPQPVKPTKHNPALHVPVKAVQGDFFAFNKIIGMDLTAKNFTEKTTVASAAAQRRAGGSSLALIMARQPADRERAISPGVRRRKDMTAAGLSSLMTDEGEVAAGDLSLDHAAIIAMLDEDDREKAAAAAADAFVGGGSGGSAGSARGGAGGGACSDMRD